MKNKGFIALISVIITSAVLLIIATALSFLSFYGRYNVLDSEIKEISVGLSEACFDQALFKLIKTPGYNPIDEIVPVGSNQCIIKSIGSLGSYKVINLEANYKNYFTILKVTVDPASDYSVISWQELP